MLYSVDAATGGSLPANSFLLSLPTEKPQCHLGGNVPRSRAEGKVVEAHAGQRSPCPGTRLLVGAEPFLELDWGTGFSVPQRELLGRGGEGPRDHVSSWLLRFTHLSLSGCFTLLLKPDWVGFSVTPT